MATSSGDLRVTDEELAEWWAEHTPSLTPLDARVTIMIRDLRAARALIAELQDAVEHQRGMYEREHNTVHELRQRIDAVAQSYQRTVDRMQDEIGGLQQRINSAHALCDQLISGVTPRQITGPHEARNAAVLLRAALASEPTPFKVGYFATHGRHRSADTPRLVHHPDRRLIMVALVEFLTARLDEREGLAMASVGEHWHAQGWSELRTAAHDEAGSSEPCWYQLAVSGTDGGPHSSHGAIDDRPTFRHIAANDPAYVLADIASKREILRQYVTAVENEARWQKALSVSVPGESFASALALVDSARNVVSILKPVIQSLCRPFADHIGFHPEWAR